MSIINYLKPDLFIDKQFSSKLEALTYFCKLLEEQGYAKKSKKILKAILARELKSSTIIGEALAIPHILVKYVNTPCILFAKVHNLDWGSNSENQTNSNVDFVFLIAFNKKVNDNSHIELIKEITSLSLELEFINKAKNINSIPELVNLISIIQQKKVIKENKIKAGKKWISYADNSYEKCWMSHVDNHSNIQK